MTAPRWLIEPAVQIARAIGAVLGVVVLVFCLMQLVPGDTGRNVLGIFATPAAVRQLDHEYGFDRPLPVQIERFLSHALHGNLGQSVYQQRPVATIIGERLGTTLWLLGYTLVLTVVFGGTLAVLGTRGHRRVDGVSRILPVASLGLPSAWVALVLSSLFAAKLSLFPLAGVRSGLVGHVWALFLPAVTLMLIPLPMFIRSLRAGLTEALASDYYFAARARGIGPGRLMTWYLLRNASVPAINILAVNASFLVGGTIIVEQVFALPGLGSLLISSVQARDLPVIVGLAVTFGLIVVVISFTAQGIVRVLRPQLTP